MIPLSSIMFEEKTWGHWLIAGMYSFSPTDPEPDALIEAALAIPRFEVRYVTTESLAGVKTCHAFLLVDPEDAEAVLAADLYRSKLKEPKEEV